jgi:hypothetical protein
MQANLGIVWLVALLIWTNSPMEMGRARRVTLGLHPDLVLLEVFPVRWNALERGKGAALVVSNKRMALQMPMDFPLATDTRMRRGEMVGRPDKDPREWDRL